VFVCGSCLDGSWWEGLHDRSHRGCERCTSSLSLSLHLFRVARVHFCHDLTRPFPSFLPFLTLHLRSSASKISLERNLVDITAINNDQRTRTVDIPPLPSPPQLNQQELPLTPYPTETEQVLLIDVLQNSRNFVLLRKTTRLVLSTIRGGTLPLRLRTVKEEVDEEEPLPFLLPTFDNPHKLSNNSLPPPPLPTYSSPPVDEPPPILSPTLMPTCRVNLLPSHPTPSTDEVQPHLLLPLVLIQPSSTSTQPTLPPLSEEEDSILDP